jgi:two-component system, sensor histidine kinase RegB
MTHRTLGRDPVWYLHATPAAIGRARASLSWASAAIAGVLVVGSFALSRPVFPLGRLAPLLAAAALVGAEIAARRTGRRPAARWLDAAGLLLQVALLTGVLELSGGPFNPFSVVYAILIAVAALTLGRRYAVLVAAASVAAYSVLVSWHLHEAVPTHHRLVDFPTHLLAMWLTIAALAESAAHFAGVASRAIAEREAELEAVRRQAARAEHLVSLTTLAAGAAHELSTPLATIAIASKELERTLARVAADGCAADARLIRQEVDRCQLVLDQMSGRAGGSAAEIAERVGVDDVLTAVRERLPSTFAPRLRIDRAPDLPALVAPRLGLTQVLLSLVTNAFDASAPGAPVTVRVEGGHGVLRFRVLDEGSGMAPEVLRRAGEPFYTTKEPGRGLGLGLFLARVFAERCGGALLLTSDRGTAAVLELPAVPGQPEAA